MSRLKKLVQEIHRRSLWQVLGIYVGGSWLAFEVVQTMTEGLGLPDWVPPAALALLIVGLPIVVATAFVQEGIGSDSPPRADPDPVRGARTESDASRIFRWRRIILGGVAVFALLGLVTAGYMASRALGIGPAATLIGQGVVERGEPIVLAEFEGADSTLARTATEGMRVGLSQSRVVRLLEGDELAEALDRMERGPNARIDLAVARELAQREGLEAVVDGRIDAAGESYLVSARIVAAADGRVLHRVGREVDEADDVVTAIGELAADVRTRIGESLQDIRDSESLERATTPSLEALRLYTLGNDAYASGEYARAVSHLDEALAIDTAFGFAHRKRAVALAALGRTAEARRAYARAYRHRDGMTDRERTETIASYHYVVRGDPARAAREYELYLERHPEQPPFNNQAHAYLNLREYREAEEAALGLLGAFGGYAIATDAHLAVGEFAEARALLDEWEGVEPENPRMLRNHGLLEALSGNREAARGWFERMGEPGYGHIGALEATRGRLQSADSAYQRERAAMSRAAGPAQHVADALDAARLRLTALGDTSGARGILTGELEEQGADELGPWDLPYEEIAAIFARLGDVETARRWLARREAAAAGEVEGRPVSVQLWGRIAEGLIALSEGRAEEAVAELERALEVPAAILCGGEACILPHLATAREAAGDPVGTIAALERYASGTFYNRPHWDAFYLGPVYERLARLYDDRGELDAAAEYYARFVALWEDADPALQPRVAAARGRLQEIVEERG